MNWIWERRRRPPLMYLTCFRGARVVGGGVTQPCQVAIVHWPQFSDDEAQEDLA